MDFPTDGGRRVNGLTGGPVFGVPYTCGDRRPGAEVGWSGRDRVEIGAARPGAIAFRWNVGIGMAVARRSGAPPPWGSSVPRQAGSRSGLGSKSVALTPRLATLFRPDDGPEGEVEHVSEANIASGVEKVEACSGRPCEGGSAGPFGVLVAALWFGIVVGLLELGLHVGLKSLRDPTPGFFRENRHAVWMIPTFNLGLFLACGLPMAAVARAWPRVGPRMAFSLYGFLGSFTLLLTYRRLHVAACLLLAVGLAYRLGRRLDGNRPRFRRLVRRTLPALALVGSAVAGVSYYRDVVVARRAPAGLPAASPGAPNVLLIVLDTVRADRLSLYGYGRPTTPRLESLAGRGVRFDRARSTAPWTLPSHASILTGRWPHQLSADFHGPLDAMYPTVAEYLSSRGYSTGGFVANLYYASAETGLGRGFSRYEDHDISPAGILQCSTLVGRTIQTSAYRKDAAQVGRQFLSWVEGVPEGRPFFAFLNLCDAHDPYIPPPGSGTHFGVRPETSADEATLRDWFFLDKETLTARQVALAIDGYDDCIAYLDDQLGRLFDELDRRGRMEDTLVIVTADHGEHFGEHGLYGHASSLYDPEIHVPLLVVPPGGAPGGRVVARSVSLRDIPSTVADLAGFGPESPFPGRSLARHWDAEPGPTTAADPVLSEVDEAAITPPNQGHSPVFRGSMKSLVVDETLYILNGDGVEELYDLDADPGEVRDLAGRPDAGAILGRFRGELGRLLSREPPCRIGSITGRRRSRRRGRPKSRRRDPTHPGRETCGIKRSRRRGGGPAASIQLGCDGVVILQRTNGDHAQAAIVFRTFWPKPGIFRADRDLHVVGLGVVEARGEGDVDLELHPRGGRRGEEAAERLGAVEERHRAVDGPGRGVGLDEVERPALAAVVRRRAEQVVAEVVDDHRRPQVDEPMARQDRRRGDERVEPLESGPESSPGRDAHPSLAIADPAGVPSPHGKTSSERRTSTPGLASPASGRDHARFGGECLRRLSGTEADRPRKGRQSIGTTRIGWRTCLRAAFIADRVGP